MTNKILPSAFIEPIITNTDYTLGSLERLKGFPDKIIRPNGQWTDIVIEQEKQKKRIETMNCTVYNTLEPIEILEKAQYKTESNHSERYTGVLAGTTKSGNTPHRVAETIRKYGLIPETLLPFAETIRSWNGYYSPNPMTQHYVNIGEKWLDDNTFGHEWAWNWKGLNLKEKQKRMIEALKRSPLGVSVLAWKQRNGLYFKYPNEGDNHWTTITGYVFGKKWICDDSYPPFIKDLDWNYNFWYCKKYYLKREESTPKKKLMTSEQLDKLYLLGLHRLSNNDESAKPYLQHDHNFVADEIVKSDEWEKIDKILEWAKSNSFWKIFLPAELKGIIEEWKKLRGE